MPDTYVQPSFLALHTGDVDLARKLAASFTGESFHDLSRHVEVEMPYASYVRRRLIRGAVAQILGWA